MLSDNAQCRHKFRLHNIMYIKGMQIALNDITNGWTTRDHNNIMFDTVVWCREVMCGEIMCERCHVRGVM